jgi:multidrug efflux system membrane fusion protein
VVYYLDTAPRTDDAYARANTIGVAPQVNGRIIALRVRDNQAVKKGDVLFEIDPTPYQHSLARSRAALESLEKQIGLSRRDVRRNKSVPRRRGPTSGARRCRRSRQRIR